MIQSDCLAVAMQELGMIKDPVNQDAVKYMQGLLVAGYDNNKQPKKLTLRDVLTLLKEKEHEETVHKNGRSVR